MKKGWKIVAVIVLIVIILGAVCVGIGALTGASLSRIYSVIDYQYGLTTLFDSLAQTIKNNSFG